MASATRLVAFTGSGVSEESGIPTFRDPGGLWDRFDPAQFGSGDIFFTMLSGARPSAQAQSFIREMVKVFEAARPNPGHLALCALEDMGILRAIITQNIDGLHRQAGSLHVIEVHGSVYRLACLECNQKMMLSHEEFVRLGKRLAEMVGLAQLEELLRMVPRCPCGGFFRLDVVGFGEPVQDFSEALWEAEHCDVLLVLGTSGVVMPAASLPAKAKAQGAGVIEVNAHAGSFSSIADVTIIGRTGDVVPLLVDEIRGLKSASG